MKCNALNYNLKATGPEHLKRLNHINCLDYCTCQPHKIKNQLNCHEDLCSKGEGLNISERNYSSKTEQSRKCELILQGLDFPFVVDVVSFLQTVTSCRGR